MMVNVLVRVNGRPVVVGALSGGCSRVYMQARQRQ